MEVNDVKIKDNLVLTENVLKAHNNDEMNILNIQISCFSYWKVFEKRFVDYCELIILRKLVYYYVKGLGLMLEKKFSPTSSGDNFIYEDPSITKKRHEIETSMKNLEQAKDKLNLIC